MEGYMDVIALHQHGEARAVAALGTSLTQEQLQKLFRLGDKVIFCFDGDKAGSAASDRAMKVALAAITDTKAVKFMSLPIGHDPDSFIREHGIDGWHQALTDMSVPLSTKMVQVLSRGLDMSLPESKVTFTREAGNLLSLMVRAPALREAIRKHIESLANLPVAVKLDTRQVLAAQEAYVPPSMVKGEPDPKRQVFYSNFALLCGLQHEFSADVSTAVIDDFAVQISIWFSVNPGDTVKRQQALEQVTNLSLRTLIGQTLERIRERFDLLPQVALDSEAKAMVDAIERDSRRMAATQHGVLMFS
jgi:DNA primase